MLFSKLQNKINPTKGNNCLKKGVFPVFWVFDNKKSLLSQLILINRDKRLNVILKQLKVAITYMGLF
ncbi:hypothetical protein ACFFU1_06485 [Algibacter miyuki]|uniref:Uncharacterized protein n=1 Tax=Algibacter miyuki TaxID=1306933 RepID=A0ABV5GY00_9FLAO|nr:hypothetical protein [Algibacter miyuki]MDN3667266.1 hypothetical protein [Algibacter miyuki]